MAIEAPDVWEPTGPFWAWYMGDAGISPQSESIVGQRIQHVADAPDAIEPLLHSVLGPGYNLAVRLTRDQADAEDLLQEAALRACRFFHQFQRGTNFRAWFFKILVNCHYHGVRQDGRRGERVSIDDAPPLHLYLGAAELGLQDSESDPAAAFLERIGTDRIDQALNALPEEYRAVASLYFVDDFTYKEIADVLEIPLGTVRSRLHRGRKMLQKKLWDAAVEHGIVSRKEES